MWGSRQHYWCIRAGIKSRELFPVEASNEDMVICYRYSGQISYIQVTENQIWPRLEAIYLSIYKLDQETRGVNLSEGEVPKDLINSTNIMAGEDPVDSFPKSPEMED